MPNHPRRRGLLLTMTVAACLSLLAVAWVVTNRSGGNVFQVQTGMTRTQVESLAGKPYRSGPNCSLYHATKSDEPNVTGMRICFTDDHVTKTQISVHL